MTTGVPSIIMDSSLSVVVSVPPLSVTILRTEVPLVAGVARRLECEVVSSNRYNISALSIISTHIYYYLHISIMSCFGNL